MLIGYFVNMLAMRVEMPYGTSVAKLLSNTREVAADGVRHAAVPFQQIVQELLLQRSHDASRSAVFQTMLAWGAEASDWNDVSSMSFGSAVSVDVASVESHHPAKVELAVSLFHYTLAISGPSSATCEPACRSLSRRARRDRDTPLTAAARHRSRSPGAWPHRA